MLNHVVNNPNLQVSYSELIASINNNEVEKIEISPDKVTAQVYYIDAAKDELPKNVAIPSIDSFMEQISEVMEKNPNFKVVQTEESILISVLSLFSPFVIILVFLLFWLLLMNPNQGGNKSMNFGKSKARLVVSSNVRFTDVAGADEKVKLCRKMIQNQN